MTIISIAFHHHLHSLAMVHPIIGGYPNEPNIFNKPCGNLVACMVCDLSIIRVLCVFKINWKVPFVLFLFKERFMK